jgi:hypothetical protein
MAGPAAPALQRKPPARRPPLQAKLAVGPTGDRFEQEADRAAARIGSSAPAAMAAPPPTVSALGAQRAALPAKPGPERKDEPAVAPERRAQRKAAPTPAPAPAKEPEKRGLAQRKEKVKQEAPKKTAQADRAAGAAVGAEGGEAPAAAEAAIARMQAGAAPGLDPATRPAVEQAVGADLGDVRVHTGSAASAAAGALGARAFTVGRDMFFGQGQFRPATTEGKRLIAHEAAHTVQQSGGSAAARKIQRAPEGTVPQPVATTKTLAKASEGWAIDFSKSPGVLTVPRLELPRIAGALKGEANAAIGFNPTFAVPKAGKNPFTRNPQPKSRDERLPEAASKVWTKDLKTQTSGLQQALQKRIKEQPDAASLSDKAGASVYVLRPVKQAADKPEALLIGTIESLAGNDALLRPMVGKASGDPIGYQVDHILEDQLGGPDSVDNMFLLESTFNMSVGPALSARIIKTIETARAAAEAERVSQEKKGVKLEGTIPPEAQAVKKELTVVFSEVGEGKGFAKETSNYWSKPEVLAGAQLQHFKALNEKELIKSGFILEKGGNPTRINVFSTRTGGKIVPFEVKPGGKGLKPPDQFFEGLKISGPPVYVPLSAGTSGQDIIELPVEYKKETKSKKLATAKGVVKIRHDPELGFGGYVVGESLLSVLAGADFAPLSPIGFTEAGIGADGKLTASGLITASKSLIPGLQIPIIVEGDDVFVRFPVPDKALKFGPIEVNDVAVDIGVGGKGFFIAGSATVLVKDVGRGTIMARGENDGVTIAGKMALDLTFLDKAELDMNYKLATDELKAKGNFSVAKGKLPGVESGQVEITASRDTFGVTGTLNLGGVLKGSIVTVGYTPETGLVMEAKDLPLPVSKLPGVSDAKVTVRAVRAPETGEWVVSGGGKATLAAPGASGSLDLLFDGGAVDFGGRVEVAKGPASGWLQINGSNRTVDEEGKPVEGAPLGDLAIWGKGEATVAFGKVLTGTAGIEYTRDGRVIVVGRIAMPPTYDLFPRKDLSPAAPLFKFKTPDFPIWGVKVGPVGVGIFGFGYISLVSTAWVGPGQVRNAAVEGVIDLDKPAEATVKGTAQFYLPAYAGLRLDIGGGLKAQAAIAYAKGTIGVYATAGLLVENSFDITVNWSQATGLEVGATPKIRASPKFEAGITAKLAVGVDLGLFDIEKEWGPWDKKLAEFGPGMTLGASFPVAWSEAKGLDIDPSKVEIEKPNLDAPKLLKEGLMAVV